MAGGARGSIKAKPPEEVAFGPEALVEFPRYRRQWLEEPQWGVN